MLIEEIILADFSHFQLDWTAFEAPSQVWVQLHLTFDYAECPKCGWVSARVHSRYVRHLQDLSLLGKSLRLHLSVRRFFCDNVDCPKRTFAEQPTGLAGYKARRTLRQKELLQTIAFAEGGKPGAKAAAANGIQISKDTMLRLLRHTSRPPQPTPRILGVDDWAKRKGVEYGTILVDLERHCPIDLLPDREADTLAKWLTDHPGVEIVSRDRASAYADGTRRGAPGAIQVADRFHLLKNLSDHLKALFERKAACLIGAKAELAEPANQLPASDSWPALTTIAAPNQLDQLVKLETEEEGQESPKVSEIVGEEKVVFEALVAAIPLAEKQTEVVVVVSETEVEQTGGRKGLLYQEIKRLANEEGCSQREIAHHLQISRQTVNKYLKAGRLPRYTPRPVQPSKLDLYKPYLEQRWQAGIYKGQQLYREIQGRGYRGSWGLLALFLAQHRIAHPPVVGRKETRGRKPKATIQKSNKRPQPLLSAREAALLMTWKVGELKEEQRGKLLHLLGFDAEVVAAYQLSQEFATMLRERKGQGLEEWLGRVEQKVASQQVRELGSFARGIRQDQAAVTAGLTLEISQGQVEGQVNRLKTLKRAMYGRASFETLKARVLHREAA